MNDPGPRRRDNQDEAVEIRAEWGPDLQTTPVQFSDQIVGSFRGEYFLVSFGQVAQPQFLPGEDRAIDELRARGTLPIRTQFRTAVPKNDFAEFLAGMVRVAKAQGVVIPLTEEHHDDTN